MCNTRKSKNPTTYEAIQKTTSNKAIRLLLVGKEVEPGRQRAASQALKTRAGIEKIPCKAFITHRKVVLEKASVEVAKGFMNKIAVKPTIQAKVTIKIVTS